MLIQRLPQGEGSPCVGVGKLLGEAEGWEVTRSVHMVVSWQWRNHSFGPL